MPGARRAAQSIFSFGRIALAVILLAGLWVGTVQGVKRASRNADQRRASDRATVASGFAHSIHDWLDAGRQEAITTSRQVFPGPGSASALDALVARRPTFSRDALMFGGSTVVAASHRFDVLVGLHPKACITTGEAGTSVADTHLDQLVARARGATSPVVSPIFDVPGDCHAVVAIAAPANGGVLVLIGDVGDATTRLAAASAGNSRIFLVSANAALDPQNGVVTTPGRISSFLDTVTAGGPHVARYGAALGAFAAVEPGWSVVLEQDAADFDIDVAHQPSVIVATVLTVVFAIVFALIAFFDIRRRRAHRRAEVAKNAFFSIAGHELRTPLTVLKGFAEALSSNWAQLTEERRRTLVERMVPQTRRLDRLVERLLVAASIQAETHARPQPRDVDVLPVVAEAVNQFRTQAPLHSFVVQSADARVMAKADPAALDQVMQHLIENAVKYSPAGGRITVEVVADAAAVRIFVDDEGIGLPSDHRHIFEKFAQGESVTKRVHDEGGVGLGLYIVRTLVEEMDGSVQAEPRELEGACFIVTLRRAAQTQGRRAGRLVRSKAG